MIASVILGGICIVTVFPAIMLLAFPEIVFLWVLPALFLLAFGGWFSDEEVNSWFKEDSTLSETIDEVVDELESEI